MTAVSPSSSLCKTSRSFSSGVITAEDIEHATGLERYCIDLIYHAAVAQLPDICNPLPKDMAVCRQELEAAKAGKDLYQEEWYVVCHNSAFMCAQTLLAFQTTASLGSIERVLPMRAASTLRCAI